jgi:hypothetical protein
MGNISGETAPAAGRQFTLNNNAYLNTSESWVYKHSSDEACQLQMFDGKFRFRTAPTGTADGNVTFTERLLLTNDGRGLSKFTAFAWANIGLDNVAAGNTSPDGSLNISTVTLQSTGVARFNYTNSSSSNNVAAVGTHNTAGGTMNWNGSTSSYLQFTCYHSNGNTESASGVNIVSFGGN